MEDKITIVKPGTPTITKIGGVKNLVTGVCIRNGSIMYEMATMVANKRSSDWYYRYEFDIDSAQKKEAGFNKPAPENSDSSEVIMLMPGI